jgi:hypothetical protein
VEIAIAGEGEVVIRFIDSRGQTLMQERLVVSGSPTIRALRTIALEAVTGDGRVPLAPVMVQQSNPQQRVTFDGLEPAQFTRKRCEEIACQADVAGDAGRGCAAPLAPGGPVLTSDDQRIARLIREVVPGPAEDRGEPGPPRGRRRPGRGRR